MRPFTGTLSVLRFERASDAIATSALADAPLVYRIRVSFQTRARAEPDTGSTVRSLLDCGDCAVLEREIENVFENSSATRASGVQRTSLAFAALHRAARARVENRVARLSSKCGDGQALCYARFAKMSDAYLKNLNKISRRARAADTQSTAGKARGEFARALRASIRFSLLLGASTALALASGCIRKSNSTPNGAACSVDADCGSGLRCIASVCTSDATSSGGVTGSSGSTSTNGGTQSGGTSSAGDTGMGGGGMSSAGVGGGSSGASASGGSGGAAQTTFDMIDDLEDGDGRIIPTEGRQGPWHTFNSGESGGTQTPNMPPLLPEMNGANGSMYAMHTSGSGFSSAGFGFDLDNADSTPESMQSMAIDASAWDGVAFSAKSGSSGSTTIRLELPMRDFVPTSRGGACSSDPNCWNVYGYQLPAALPTDWTEFKVPFSQLSRQMGGNTPAFDAKQLMSISFTHYGTNDHFDFWVDNVRFYKDPSGGSTGGSGGASAGGAGGATSNPMGCGFGTPQNGSGSFTEYWFGQGTTHDGSGFRTACGYYGTETGDNTTDSVQNIANPQYFAAVPSMSAANFDTNNLCGACAQITNGSKSIVVTVIDACPNDMNQPCAMNPNGHLDLSVPAMNALGYASGYPMGTTWKYVPCPVTGNVVVRIKPGNTNQVFIENEIFPIQTVQMNGQMATRLSYGAWQLPGDAAGQTLTLTDLEGRTITVQVSGSEGQDEDSGKQFPVCQ